MSTKPSKTALTENSEEATDAFYDAVDAGEIRAFTDTTKENDDGKNFIVQFIGPEFTTEEGSLTVRVSEDVEVFDETHEDVIEDETDEVSIDDLPDAVLTRIMEVFSDGGDAVGDDVGDIEDVELSPEEEEAALTEAKKKVLADKKGGKKNDKKDDKKAPKKGGKKVVKEDVEARKASIARVQSIVESIATGDFASADAALDEELRTRIFEGVSAIERAETARLGSALFFESEEEKLDATDELDALASGGDDAAADDTTASDDTTKDDGALDTNARVTIDDDGIHISLDAAELLKAAGKAGTAGETDSLDTDLALTGDVKPSDETTSDTTSDTTADDTTKGGDETAGDEDDDEDEEETDKDKDKKAKKGDDDEEESSIVWHDGSAE